MNRWHSPPAELYALVEQTPATVLLECAKSPGPDLDSAPDSARPGQSLTRLFTDPLSVCVANHSSELPGLFAEIESAAAAGHFAAGFFTYECGSFFEPTVDLPLNQPGQSLAQPLAQPLAWIGIYQRPFSSTIRQETSSTAIGLPLPLSDLPYLTRSRQPPRCRMPQSA